MIGTKGIKFYTYYTIWINYYEDIDKLFMSNNSNCYRLIFIEDGIGSIVINQCKIDVLPLICLCLSETDIITDIDVSGLTMHLICFLPSAINNKLTLNNINNNEGLTISDSQDKHFILPFIEPRESVVILKSIDSITGKRFVDILLSLKDNLLVQNNSWPCLSRSYLIELLFLVGRLYSCNIDIDHSADNKSKVLTDGIMSHINNNYMNKITISDLAKKFNTNRTTLSKEFKNTTNYTIISYVLKTRVQIASDMLKATELSVADIIDRVGFNNITHFNKVFKKQMQCLPHEFRKRFKEQ